jgi:hypothetical protein
LLVIEFAINDTPILLGNNGDVGMVIRSMEFGNAEGTTADNVG